MVNVQSKALSLLIENKVDSLPIDPIGLSCKDKQWFIGTYLEDKGLIDSLSLSDVCCTYKAFAVKTPEGHYYIFYDDTLPLGERNYYISHEIGHIVLGHNAVGFILGKSNDPKEESEQEREADAFALYLTAPTCILANADITSSREIISYTTLAEHYAKDVAYEISQLKSYISMDEERKLCRQFAPFIFKKKLYKYGKYGIILFIIAVLCAATYLVTRSAYSGPSGDFTPIINTDFPLPLQAPATSVEPTSQGALEIPERVHVFITPSGDKFHLENCRYVKGKDTTEMTIEEAILAGKGACSVCKPLGE